MLKETENQFRRKLLEDINDICKASDGLFLDEANFELIFTLYQRYRIEFHNYMNERNRKEKPIIKMDRHKIAAAFFCAILKAMPIGKKPGFNRFVERTANEQLALIFSVLYIVDKFNISDTHKTEIDKGIYNLEVKFPECIHSDIKDYKVNFIMLFIDKAQRQIIDIDSEKFQPGSLFIISHLFFVLDAYSYQKNFQLVKEYLS
ncbi:MAG: hypothetical protein FWD24_02320 [Treponema sp.]|nr:hypothetical protein [Treponema sp.]